MAKAKNHRDDLDVMERDVRQREVSEYDVGDPEVTPFAASVSTVTVANPTPPTNIPYVAYGTPPMAGMTVNANPRLAPTYTGDCALVPVAGLTPNPTAGVSTIPTAAVALTAIATPVGGSGGTGVSGGRADSTAAAVIPVLATTAEAAGSVVIVTAPGSVAAAPTQSISVMGNWSGSPNTSHPSSAPQILSLVPAAPVSGGGTLALTVYGRGFNQGSIVTVAAVAQTTVYISSSQLYVAAAPRKATAGISTVSVTTDSVVCPIVNWNFS